MSRADVLNYLISEYNKELRNREKIAQWSKENPLASPWQYTGPLPNKAKLKRLGITIREQMVQLEKGWG